MAALVQAGIGNVVAGSFFAILQSIGALFSVTIKVVGVALLVVVVLWIVLGGSATRGQDGEEPGDPGEVAMQAALLGGVGERLVSAGEGVLREAGRQVVVAAQTEKTLDVVVEAGRQLYTMGAELRRR